MRIVWSPQEGPQKALIDCPLPEIFFGGARGGGKTDGILGKYAIKGEMYGERFNAVFFRKEMPQQDDLIERAKEIYGPIGAVWYEQKKLFKLPRGGRIRFRPLENVLGAEKYQGQNLTDAAVEEAGNYADPSAIDRLNGALRSVTGVPTQLILTANPGGPGQMWIKQRYIDPAPSGMKILTRKLPNGAEHRSVYIPSRVENNQLLIRNDPGYINRLYLVGSEQLVEAWLRGDWSKVEGAFFDKWSDALIIDPFPIPEYWNRFKSFDWGSAKPFSVGWWAVASEDVGDIPEGAMIRYREWYGAKKDERTGKSIANVGLKLTAYEVGKGIRELEEDEPCDVMGYADPAIFSEDGGPSIAERMEIPWFAADNKRVARNGAMGGWDQMRGRMAGVDGVPMIYCFNTCVDSIRTIPFLQHDQRRAEDLDTESEDHAADEWRYGCMSRPWTAPTPDESQTKDRWNHAFGHDNAESWKTV